MNRLVGGLVLLNLATISLNLSAGEQSITDPDVLKQLEDLRIFIDENRDFSKQSSKGLKPVLVQYRSNESKFDGIVLCNLSFNTDALHLSIGGTSKLADGSDFSILINVVYEWTEYVGYTIKTATLTCSNTKVKVDDVKNIDGAIIEQLKCGDIVIKEDASSEHAYVVTFKSETGICLTYADASVVETQSYDLVDDEWVYNLEDKWEMTKPIYCHPIYCTYARSDLTIVTFTCLIFNNDPTPFTKTSFLEWAINLFANYNDASVMASGYVGETPCSRLKIHPSTPTDSIALEAVTSGGQANSYYTIDETQLTNATFRDGVNKIN